MGPVETCGDLWDKKPTVIQFRLMGSKGPKGLLRDGGECESWEDPSYLRQPRS